MTRRFSADEQVKCFSLLCPLLCGLPVLSAPDAESKAVHMQNRVCGGRFSLDWRQGAGCSTGCGREPDANTGEMTLSLDLKR